MPVKSDDPLRRCTLNLYEADCVWLEREYGRGWTERVRQHIHSVVHDRQIGHPRTSTTKIDFPMPRRTLGDLSE
jgi:hypothetical protein